ncbi:MAG: hypothetical protein IBX64_06995 [Actinobacteria bacterium]|nr:hypothetical protein [Actinomycetota bacterium]
MFRAIKKGFRNGNWKKLDLLKRAHFRAAIAYAKIKGRIVNSKVLKMVLDVIERLTSSVKRRIWQRGLEAAHAMRRRFEKGFFDWCPQIRDWLGDPDYIFYLGVSSVNPVWRDRI